MLSIASASRSDAADIARIQVQGLQAGYRGIIPDEYIDMPVSTRRIESWSGWIDRSRVITIVGRQGGEIIGFCTMQPEPSVSGNDRTAELVALYVIPSIWRQGVGTMLCEKILALVRDEGFDETVLWTLESNLPARHFYEAMGFQEQNERRVFLETSTQPIYEIRCRIDCAPETHVNPNQPV